MRPMPPRHVPENSGLILKKKAQVEEAEHLVAAFLGYLAEEPDRMMRFFDLTGLTPQTLRQAAARPGFFESVLEYLGSDDRLLLAFATSTGRDPAQIEAIRRSRMAGDDGDG